MADRIVTQMVDSGHVVRGVRDGSSDAAPTFSTQAPVIVAYKYQDVTYSVTHDTFFAVARYSTIGPRIVMSTDGYNWTHTDGLTWDTARSGVPYEWSAANSVIFYDDVHDRLFLGFLDGKIAYSDDLGETWTGLVPGDAGALEAYMVRDFAVSPDSGRIIAVQRGQFSGTSTQEARYAYSDDGGVSWVNSGADFGGQGWIGASPTSIGPSSVEYANGRWVAVGYSRRIGYSDDDGITWTVTDMSGSPGDLHEIRYLKGAWYVASGNSNAAQRGVWSSTAQDATPSTFAKLYSTAWDQRSVAHDGKALFSTGDNNPNNPPPLYWKPDGGTAEELTIPATGGSGSIQRGVLATNDRTLASNGTLSWSARAPLPVERTFAAVVAADKTGPQSHIYVIGGYDNSTPPGDGNGAGNAVKTIYEYDVAADSWTQLPDIPTDIQSPTVAIQGKAEMGVAAIGQYIYLFCGYGRYEALDGHTIYPPGTIIETNTTACFRFDVVNGTWLKLANLGGQQGGQRRAPVAAVFHQYFAGSSIWEDKIHCGGGFFEESDTESDTTGSVYNPRQDSWGGSGAVSPGQPILHGAVGSDGAHLWWSGADRVDADGNPITATRRANPGWPNPEDTTAEELGPQARHIGHTLPFIQNRIFQVGGSVDGNAISNVYVLDRGTLTWTEEASLPEPRMKHGTCVAQGSIFVVSGEGLTSVREGTYTAPPDVQGVWQGREGYMPRYEHSLTHVNVDGTDYLFSIAGREDGVSWGRRNSRYNCATGEWDQRTLIPIWNGLANHNAVELGGYVYLLGGTSNSQTGITTVCRYDPAADTWATLASMPRARHDAFVAVFDGKIYCLGGVGISISVPHPHVDVYDPATGWTQKADAPWGLGQGGAVASGDYIYCVGGRRRFEDGTYVQNEIVRYHPATDTWEVYEGNLGSKSQHRVGGWAVFGDRLFVVGGNAGQSSSDPDYRRTVRSFDARSGWWGEFPNFVLPVSAARAAFVDSRLYVQGGLSYVQRPDDVWDSDKDGSLYSMDFGHSNVAMAVDRQDTRDAHPVRGVLSAPALTELAGGWTVVGKPAAHEALADHHISTRVERGQDG